MLWWTSFFTCQGHACARKAFLEPAQRCIRTSPSPLEWTRPLKHIDMTFTDIWICSSSSHISGWRCWRWVTRPAAPSPGTGPTSARAWGWRVGARPGSPGPPWWSPPARPRWTRSPGSCRRPQGRSAWWDCWAGTCLHFSEPGSRYLSSPCCWNCAGLSERVYEYKLCTLYHSWI